MLLLVHSPLYRLDSSLKKNVRYKKNEATTQIIGDKIAYKTHLGFSLNLLIAWGIISLTGGCRFDLCTVFFV